MPVYEYACRACGQVEEHLQPMGSPAPGPCQACGGELRRRWSRVAVKYQSWGFTHTDRLVSDDKPRRDFRELRERADRIAEGGE
jgi:putative FmdB family regulatory protein